MRNFQTFDSLPLDKDRGPTILVVDDSELSRVRLGKISRDFRGEENIKVIEARNKEEAIAILTSNTVQLCLLDKDLGKNVDGIELIPELLQIQPHLQIIMVTGHSSVEAIVKAINYGAIDYITKDSDDSLIHAKMKRSLNTARLHIENIRAVRGHQKEISTIVGNSSAILQVKEKIPALAETARPVLILGESGTGKTTVADAIHEYRERFLKERGRPFFALNLASLPPTLIERELFGNEAGAFSGANKMKQGFFELANHGTLFLDEIGEISLDLQVKLLKVIETGKFYRIGGTRELQSAIKLICATNRDLQSMVQAGEFRQDLFMRISTLTIEMPTLTERKEDIPQLVRSLLPKCCGDNKVFIEYEDLPQDFIDYLIHQPFVGNIRGIEQQISRLLVFCPRDQANRPVLSQWMTVLKSGPVQKQSSKKNLTGKDVLSLPIEFITDGFPGLKKTVEALERKILIEASIKYKTNKEIARVLQIPESVSSSKMGNLRGIEKRNRPGRPKKEKEIYAKSNLH